MLEMYQLSGMTDMVEAKMKSRNAKCVFFSRTSEVLQEYRRLTQIYHNLCNDKKALYYTIQVADCTSDTLKLYKIAHRLSIKLVENI